MSAQPGVKHQLTSRNHMSTSMCIELSAVNVSMAGISQCLDSPDLSRHPCLTSMSSWSVTHPMNSCRSQHCVGPCKGTSRGMIPYGRLPSPFVEGPCHGRKALCIPRHAAADSLWCPNCGLCHTFIPRVCCFDCTLRFLEQDSSRSSSGKSAVSMAANSYSNRLAALAIDTVCT